MCGWGELEIEGGAAARGPGPRRGGCAAGPQFNQDGRKGVSLYLAMHRT